jgi:hypothetical protein
MHYYGYKLHEVENLQANEYTYLIELMHRAQAQERMELLELIVYPHTKEKNQSDIHKKLTRAAVPPKEMEKRAVKAEDLKTIFGSSIEDIIKARDGR